MPSIKVRRGQAMSENNSENLSSAHLSRREILSGALGIAAASSLLPIAALAQSSQMAGISKTKVGAFEVASLYDGFVNLPLDNKFVVNAPFADVQAALAKAGMQGNTLTIPFSMTYIDTGKKKILIDTGTGGQLAPTAGLMLQSLSQLGVSASDIDVILISHFHADHISGLRTKEGALVFPKAEVHVPELEWNYWMSAEEASRAGSPQGRLCFSQKNL